MSVKYIIDRNNHFTPACFTENIVGLQQNLALLASYLGNRLGNYVAQYASMKTPGKIGHVR